MISTEARPSDSETLVVRHALPFPPSPSAVSAISLSGATTNLKALAFSSTALASAAAASTTDGSSYPRGDGHDSAVPKIYQNENCTNLQSQ